MFVGSSSAERLARVIDRAAEASPKLFAEVCGASDRLRALRAMGRTQHLDQLLTAEGWCDAALELLSLDAPGWTVQRICQDDSEWVCTLTRFAGVPEWLADDVECRHRVMSLAILGAVAEVRVRATADNASPSAVTDRHQAPEWSRLARRSMQAMRRIGGKTA